MSVNKKSNCEIIIDDDNLKNLGFSKASTVDKNIFIKFCDGRSTGRGVSRMLKESASLALFMGSVRSG